MPGKPIRAVSIYWHLRASPMSQNQARYQTRLGAQHQRLISLWPFMAV